MGNEQKKSDNHNCFYYIIAGVLLFTIINFTMRSCGNDAGTAEVHQCTDATMERIEKEHTNAGRELDTVGAELDSAGTAVGRTDELVDRSQECVVRNTESVIECQQIVSECRKIIADCNHIIGEIEAANRAGEGSSKGC